MLLQNFVSIYFLSQMSMCQRHVLWMEEFQSIICHMWLSGLLITKIFNFQQTVSIFLLIRLSQVRSWFHLKCTVRVTFYFSGRRFAQLSVVKLYYSNCNLKIISQYMSWYMGLYSNRHHFTLQILFYRVWYMLVLFTDSTMSLYWYFWYIVNWLKVKWKKIQKGLLEQVDWWSYSAEDNNGQG